MMHGWFGNGSWMMPGGIWWMGLLMMIIQLLFWGTVIYFAVKLIRNYLSKQDNTLQNTYKNEDSAMAILRERYAKGEIDLEEFNTRKKELER